MELRITIDLKTNEGIPYPNYRETQDLERKLRTALADWLGDDPRYGYWRGPATGVGGVSFKYEDVEENPNSTVIKMITAEGDVVMELSSDGTISINNDVGPPNRMEVTNGG